MASTRMKLAYTFLHPFSYLNWLMYTLEFCSSLYYVSFYRFITAIIFSFCLLIRPYSVATNSDMAVKTETCRILNILMKNKSCSLFYLTVPVYMVSMNYKNVGCTFILNVGTHLA